MHLTTETIEKEMTGPELPLSLSALYPGHSLLVDRDRDGLADAVAFRIVVAPGVRDARLWAAVCNLAARISMATVALDQPLVVPARGGQAQGPLLRVSCPTVPSAAALRSGKEQGEQKERWAEIRRTKGRDAADLTLRGNDAARMAGLLDRIAPPGADDDPNDGLAEGWGVVRFVHAPAPVVTVLDGRGGRLSVFSFKEKVPGDTGGGQNGGPTNNDLKEPIDPFALRLDPHWFTIDPADPRHICLAGRILLASPTISAAVGITLSRAVIKLTAGVTRLANDPVVCRAPGPQVPVLRIEQCAGEKGRTDHAARIQVAGRQLRLKGPSRTLAAILGQWIDVTLTEAGARCAAVDGFRNHIQSFQQILAGKGYWGRWAHALVTGAAKEKTLPAVASSDASRVARACKILAAPPPETAPSPMQIKRRMTWTTETDRIIKRVKKIKPGNGRIRGLLFASKPLDRRKALEGRVTAILRDKGYAPDIWVCNAYKPGLCWLLEKVIPAVKACREAARVVLAYKPFEGHAAQLELGGRWLQEIFPGPDLLEQRLGLSRRRVSVRRADGDQVDVYQVTVFDDQGRLLSQMGFSPRWERSAYRMDDEAMGYVHPTVSGVYLATDEKVLLDMAAPTDRQVFWQRFQKRWLPELKKAMKARAIGKKVEQWPAFWESIRISVHIEETDERLGLDRERVCPMEALHEDIYFYLLRVYEDFAADAGLPDTLGLGAVLPVVGNRGDGGAPFAELIARPLPWPDAPEVSVPTVAPWIDHVKRRSGAAGWEIGFAFDGTAAFADKLVAIGTAWGFRCRRRKNCICLSAYLPAGESTHSAMGAAETQLPDIPDRRYLSMARTQAVMDALAAHPRLHVWTAGRSHGGRPVRVMEAYSVPQSDVLSIPRLRLLKPTVLINARHHANEISSTPAVLRLAADLAAGRLGETLRKTNVVWIPMENMDGVATFEAIQSQGPDHKLHAARYNAVGAEYYGDYFRAAPRFPEAAVKPLLWRRWLPELMADLHGVPGHEWDQPFSGYAPVRFREFWIPRTWIYIHLPFIEDTSHAGHADAARLVETLRRCVAEEEALLAGNRRLTDRYLRYARGPEPGEFPAVDNDILIALPVLGRIIDSNFAKHYPGITRSEIIAEVPDEVVDGKDLALCVLAHYKIQEALLRAVSVYSPVFRYARDSSGRPVSLGWRVSRNTDT